MKMPSAVVGGEGIARHHAQVIAADPETLAAYEVGALDVPENVAAALEALLRRSPRDYHSPDDVTLLRGYG